MTDSPLLLTAKQAARTLGISRALLYSLVSQGKIRRVKFGDARSSASRFRLADLEKFIESHLK